MGGGGRAWRDAHLSDDEAVAKMGHPIGWQVGVGWALPVFQEGDEDGGEEGGEDAVGADGDSGEGGREGVLGDDAGGTDAAAGGAGGEASGGGFGDPDALEDGVDGDRDQDAAEDGEDGGEGGEASDGGGDRDGDGGGEGFGGHGEGDGLAAAEQTDEAVTRDDADDRAGEQGGHHGPEAAAHVLEGADHGDGQSDGGGAEEEVDELGSGEVVVIGEVEEVEDDADEDDGDEDGVGERVAQALLDLDSKEVGAEGEGEGEERDDAGGDGVGQIVEEAVGEERPVHRPSFGMKARRPGRLPKRCMIQAVTSRVRKVLPTSATEMGSQAVRRRARFATMPTPAGTKSRPSQLRRPSAACSRAGSGSRRRRMYQAASRIMPRTGPGTWM